MGFLPPTACQFEAFLDDVAMAAFDFSGANRQSLLPGRGVIQMGAPFVQRLVGGVAGLGGGVFSVSRCGCKARNTLATLFSSRRPCCRCRHGFGCLGLMAWAAAARYWLTW